MQTTNQPDKSSVLSRVARIAPAKQCRPTFGCGRDMNENHSLSRPKNPTQSVPNIWHSAQSKDRHASSATPFVSPLPSQEVSRRIRQVTEKRSLPITSGAPRDPPRRRTGRSHSTRRRPANRSTTRSPRRRRRRRCSPRPRADRTLAVVP